MTVKNMKIQLRRDTASNWTTKNPVLLSGEMGIETDTNKFKFGDGNKTWTQLDYALATDIEKPIEDNETPTTSTVGAIGQIFVDTLAGNAYICVGISSGTYTWKKITE